MKGNFVSTCLKVLTGALVGAGVVGIGTKCYIKNRKKIQKTLDNKKTDDKKSD